MHIGTIAALCLLLACASAVNAENGSDPASFACNFASGTAWTYENRAFKGKTPQAISFDIINVDLEGQAAQVVGEGAAKPATVRIVRALNANHFLEVVNEGFLNLTTVFDRDESTGLYPAVHTRHFGVLGQPLVAQYIGSCRAK